MNNNFVNMASFDDAFGLHFKDDYADPDSLKIKRLEKRVNMLENEVNELKELLQKQLDQLEKLSQQQSSQSIFGYITSMFGGLFHKKPVKMENLNTDTNGENDELKDPIQFKNRTHTIPKEEFDKNLDNIIKQRHKEDEYFLEGEMTFEKFMKERDDTINGIYDQMQKDKNGMED